MHTSIRSRSLQLAVTFAVLLLAACTLSSAAAGHQKVLLKDVNNIVLSRTGMTTGRRNSPIAQMQCMGGPCRYAPSTILCTNAGFDGVDVLWKCKADLEKGLKLGQVSVNCEGFDYPDDPYILRGSCALEYTIEGRALVEQGQAQNQYHAPGHHHDSRHHEADSHHSSSHFGSLVTWLIIAGVVYVIYKGCTGNGGVGGLGRGGGGGGGGGSFPPGGPGYGSGFGSGFGGSSYSSADCAPSAASSSSGPGFWTGAALGAAGGYFAGSRGGSNTRSNAYVQPSGGYSSGSSWGSSSPGPSSMGTSSSSSFGGTKRR